MDQEALAQLDRGYVRVSDLAASQVHEEAEESDDESGGGSAELAGAAQLTKFRDRVRGWAKAKGLWHARSGHVELAHAHAGALRAHVQRARTRDEQLRTLEEVVGGMCADAGCLGQPGRVLLSACTGRV